MPYYNLAGRNATGSIVLRTKGCRVRKRIRRLDSNYYMYNIPGYVCRLEYDPNRSAFISLILYANGMCAYTLHTLGINVGSRVILHSDISAVDFNEQFISFVNGDSCALYCTPGGTILHGLEILPFKGSSYIHAAGTYGVVLRKFSRLRSCTVRLPTAQIRSFSIFCCFTKGIVSNDVHYRVKLGKAGRHRLLGRNPIVRGVAKNPVDHPHGGGEGKKSKKCFPRTA